MPSLRVERRHVPDLERQVRALLLLLEKEAAPTAQVGAAEGVAMTPRPFLNLEDSTRLGLRLEHADRPTWHRPEGEAGR